MNSETEFEPVFCGIVTYNPDILRLLDNLEAIIPQVSEVLIYDNGSSNISDIELMAQELPNVSVFESQKNGGMSVALNHLCNSALFAVSSSGHRYRYILTLDQDSIALPNMVRNLLKHVREGVGVVAPVSYNRGFPAECFESSVSVAQEVARANTSGSLINLAAFSACGGYNEKLFVDWVDFEFCLRLREHGYRIVASPDAYLLHDLGHAKYICRVPWFCNGHFVSRELVRTNHPLHRQRDCARSWAITLHDHSDSPLVRAERIHILRGIVQRFITEPNKIELLRALFEGYREGKRVVRQANFRPGGN